MGRPSHAGVGSLRGEQGGCLRFLKVHAMDYRVLRAGHAGGPSGLQRWGAKSTENCRRRAGSAGAQEGWILQPLASRGSSRLVELRVEMRK